MSNKYYAVLNDNDICIGVSSLAGTVQDEKMIEIPAFSDDYIYRKYDRTTTEWSSEKFEPKSTAPLDDYTLTKQKLAALEVENTELKERQQIMQQAFDELLLGGM